MLPVLQTNLAKLAALRSAIDQRIAREIRSSGRSWRRTDEMIAEYVALREAIRKEPSGALSDIPRRTWTTSIASQSEVLKDVRSEADYVLSLATQLGLFRPVDLPLPSAAEEQRGEAASWIRDHVVQLLLGLLLAYLVFRLGWNR